MGTGSYPPDSNEYEKNNENIHNYKLLEKINNILFINKAQLIWSI